jgi:hypothetical protein
LPFSCITPVAWYVTNFSRSGSSLNTLLVKSSRFFYRRQLALLSDEHPVWILVENSRNCPHVHFSCSGNDVSGFGQSGTVSYGPEMSWPPFSHGIAAKPTPGSAWALSGKCVVPSRRKFPENNSGCQNSCHKSAHNGVSRATLSVDVANLSSGLIKKRFYC